MGNMAMVLALVVTSLIATALLDGDTTVLVECEDVPYVMVVPGRDTVLKGVRMTDTS